MSDQTSGGVPSSGDESLQRWGKNLDHVSGAAEEVRRKYAEAEASAQQFRDTYGKVRTTGETELPASHRLMAEVDSIGHRANTAGTADAWSRIATDSQALPKIYGDEHETDNDRLHHPRNSHAAEKRADVGTAAQDT